MKWYNSRISKLPRDRQEVLLSVAGGHHVATFDANKKEFEIKDPGSRTYKADKKDLYWTRYNRPGE